MCSWAKTGRALEEWVLVAGVVHVDLAEAVFRFIYARQLATRD